MNLFGFNLYGDPALTLSEKNSGHTVSTPDIPAGPSTGQIRKTYDFSTGGSACLLGHDLEYRFDWGDGTYSEWSSSPNASHLWTVYDSYTIKTQARCAVNKSITSSWSGAAAITLTVPVPPSTPNNPYPADSVSDVSIKTNLDWDDCTDTESYNIYFGRTNPPSYIASATESQYDLPVLEYGVTYYWKIKAVGASGSTQGPDWHFSTLPMPDMTAPSSLQVIPEVIWAQASGGGTWLTEVSITDLTGGSQVSATFSDGTGANRGPFLLWTGSSPHSSIKFGNLLLAIENIDSLNDDYFGKVGAVVFYTQSPEHKIHVTSRTSNGNYSKSIQGLNKVPANTASTARPMMVQNLVSNDMYRSGAGFFNPTGNFLTIEFSLINSSGAIIGQPFSRTVEGSDFISFNPFLEAGVPFPANSYDNAWLLIDPVQGSGDIFCFGTTTNNITNDPAVHWAVQAADGYDNSPDSQQILPEVIWAPAQGNGQWITEVQITDRTGGSIVSIYFNSSQGDRRGPFVLWTSGGINKSIKLENLLETINELDPIHDDYFGKVGSMEFFTQDDSHKVHVSSRTFNGNYSKTSQGLNKKQINLADTTQDMMIQNLTSDAIFRSGIGCFNITGDTVTVEFRLTNGAGVQIGSSFSRTFSAYSFLSFNPFAQAGIPYPAASYDNVWLHIKPFSGSGKIMSYGATANNITNDPAVHTAVLH
jgi:hypothetical protein